jgi:hypothetical protein
MLSYLPVIDKQNVRAQRVGPAVLKLDAWLQTMLSPSGFMGPISHWWESCLIYCGPMIDWRYEGIISAYVTLFEETGRQLWLERAKEAAEHVVAAQLPSGNFRNSSFQHGAIEGGTPHEAAVDVGLLELARLLHRLDDESWLRYFRAAERNIDGYLTGPLWSERGFREQPWDATLVPNKNATPMEALLLYEELSGRDMRQYVEPALQVILSNQEHSGVRKGGTVHRGTGKHQLAISIYTARSMSAVLRLYEYDARAELLDAAAEAMTFLNRLITGRGTYFGFYRDGSLVANPRWIAPSGDVLRAAVLADKYGAAPPGMIDALVDLLLEQQLPSGGLPTAYGFAERGGRRPHQGLPEFRDVLPVVGWCDKALRALSLLCSPALGGAVQAEVAPCEVSCTWKGRRCTYVEDDGQICLRDELTGRVRYRWYKGRVWSDVYEL